MVERLIVQVAKLRTKGVIVAPEERSCELFIEQRLRARRRSVVAEEGKRAEGGNALRARKFLVGSSASVVHQGLARTSLRGVC